MTSELVVDVQPKEVSIALLEDKSLVELQSEGRNISFSVGNMYLGRIKKLMPGLNACFVDVGYEKDAFLHYLDLGPQFNSLEKFVKQTLSDKKKLTSISKATLLPDLDKDGTVSNTLKVGQEVVVQIVIWNWEQHLFWEKTSEPLSRPILPHLQPIHRLSGQHWPILFLTCSALSGS